MMNEFKNEIERTNSMQMTENGAMGYSTTGKELVDLNFKVPSFRNGVDVKSIEQFNKSVDKNLLYTVKWLFYLRDAREGLGERRAFFQFFNELYKNNRSTAVKTISIIAEYGRWKDIIDIIANAYNNELKNECLSVIKNQLMVDVDNFTNGKSISLLAKWMPSINSSDKARRVAIDVVSYLNMSKKDYRKMLSKLRKYLDVTEVKTCAGQWSEIDYSKVSSNANLKYKNAFMKHDEVRRNEFLNAVLSNSEDKPTIKASVLYPYEIWNKYTSGAGYYGRNVQKDNALEALWQNLKNIDCGGNTMVVCDGSGSMTLNIGNGSVRAIDVSRSLSVYFAERCEGEFKNKFIEFSANPKFIDINGCETLVDKISHVSKYTDCSNTDIEKVFMLLLNTAVKNKMTQADMPDRILVISDMEFDGATQITRCYSWGYPTRDIMSEYKTLFENLGEKYKEYGFTLPKLVFWNVNSRTNTIPLRENEAGVILVSGFSVNIAKMVMSGQTDPWLALKETLDNERYNLVEEALA